MSGAIDLPLVRSLPSHGRDHATLLEELEALRVADADWRDGRVFSLVYDPGHAHEAFLQEAHGRYFCENGLNPMAFKSLHRMETDVVRMVGRLLHGDAETCGTMTSGGTESLLLAVKTARDRARRLHPWNHRPEMILPTTAHVAFDKAADAFGVRIRRARLTADLRVDVRHVKRLINRHTVLVVASAPQYPHGVVDPVAEIGQLALKRKIPFHVDACVGGMILPFIERLGRPVPPWDFRVPGVTSLSADLHKYGYTAKGASVLLHRSRDYLQDQIFIATDWPGGVYASPTLPGTRPGGTIAAAWAGMQAMGEDGYLALARQTLAAADELRAGVRAIDGLKLLSPDDMPIVTWASGAPDVDVYAVADQLEARGWHIDRQQDPPSVHLTVMAGHERTVGAYVSDLGEAVRYVRAHPGAKSQGNAAMYGMMAKVPFRGMIRKTVRDMYLEMYGPEGGAKQGDPPPPEGLVGKLLAEHGEKIDRALDLYQRLRKRLTRGN